MAFVLTNLHVLNCPHVAPATKTPAPKLVVETQAVLTNVGPVTGCTNTPTMATPTNVVCTTVTISAGKATKLKVGGTPVLLSTLSASAASPPANPGGPLVYVPPGPPTPTKLNAV
jgi:hypothetical protein